MTLSRIYPGLIPGGEDYEEPENGNKKKHRQNNK